MIGGDQTNAAAKRTFLPQALYPYILPIPIPIPSLSMNLESDYRLQATALSRDPVSIGYHDSLQSKSLTIFPTARNGRLLMRLKKFFLMQRQGSRSPMMMIARMRPNRSSSCALSRRPTVRPLILHGVVGHEW